MPKYIGFFWDKHDVCHPIAHDSLAAVQNTLDLEVNNDPAALDINTPWALFKGEGKTYTTKQTFRLEVVEDEQG